MVMDQYRPTWPAPNTTPVVPWDGTGITFPTITFTPAQEKTALEAFEELCAAARKLDEILGLPDCEDPKKAEWIESVRARVREHELAKIEERLK
jgi:hypothetical protein